MTVANKRLELGATVLCLTCAAIWDFRPNGIRVLDIVPHIFLALYAAKTLWDERYIRVSKEQVLVFTFFCAYCVYGYYTYHHASSLVVMLHVFFVLLFFSLRPISFHTLQTAAKYVLILIILSFLVQLFVYCVFDFVLDLQNLFGGESRLNLHTSVVRFAGAYQEPHNYAVAVTIFVLMTLGRRDCQVLHLLGCLTMVLSFSLWGIVSGVFLAVVSQIWLERSFGSLFRYGCLSALILAAIVSIYSTTLSSFERMIGQTADRLLNFYKHTVFKERFLDNRPQEGHHRFQEYVRLSKDMDPPVFFDITSFDTGIGGIFGDGLSTYPFVLGLPLNTYAFLLNSFGMVSLVLLLAGGYVVWQRLEPIARFKRVVLLASILLLFLSYPLITYSVGWVFLISLFLRRTPATLA